MKSEASSEFKANFKRFVRETCLNNKKKEGWWAGTGAKGSCHQAHLSSIPGAYLGGGELTPKS